MQMDPPMSSTLMYNSLGWGSLLTDVRISETLEVINK